MRALMASATFGDLSRPRRTWAQPWSARACCRPVPHVASEAIAQIEYDAATRTLFVCFSDGDWYGYAGVPPAVHEAFVAAPSHGRFFHDHIREAYPHTGPLPL